MHTRTHVTAGLLLLLSAAAAAPQASPPPGRAIGGNYLVSLDFAATAVGDFPATVDMVDGVMEVVDMNGRHMLRASAPSAFLIRLPSNLPTDFTVDVDLVPKLSGNENDFGLEGTPTINQGTASAYLLWHSEYLRVIGGAIDNFETKVPEALAVSTQGVLTRVTMVMQGTTMRMYTNGRLLSTLPNRRFVRGPVLRVFLGGQDDGSYAVHLAALRITASAMSGSAIAAGSALVPPAPAAANPAATNPPPTNPPPTTNPPPPPSRTPPPAGNVGVPNVLNDAEAPTVGPVPTPGGVELKYNEVTGAQGYTVCRESPAGAPCQPVVFSNVAVVNGIVSAFDLGLPAGTSHAYRVRAVQPNGHYGEGGPASASVGALPSPANVRVTGVTSASSGTVTIAWDPVPYVDHTGSRSLTTYEVSGTGLANPLRVTGTQVVVPLSTTTGTYVWHVTAVLTGQSGSVHRSTPGQVTYVCRYRIVALGVVARHATGDNALTFDGAEDEIYVATATGLTDRALTSPVVTVSRSATFGDVAGFANRIKAGSATPNGGIRNGDAVPATIDINAPVGTPSPAFPLPLWEGPLDDHAMLVMHNAVWESDNNSAEYLKWVNTISYLVKSGFGAEATTVQGIQQAAAAGDFGPVQAYVAAGAGANYSLTRCDAAFSIPRSVFCIDGEDRPLGLVPYLTTGRDFHHRFLVLTRAAIEKSLLLAPSRQPIAAAPFFDKSAPGVIVLDFTDGTAVPPLGSGDYMLVLKVERVP